MCAHSLKIKHNTNDYKINEQIHHHSNIKILKSLTAHRLYWNDKSVFIKVLLVQVSKWSINKLHILFKL